MPIDLQICVAGESVPRRYKIPQTLSEKLDLYIEAAREQYPEVDESTIMEAIIGKHLKKDRSFNAWLSDRNATKKRRGSAIKPYDQGAQTDPSVTEPVSGSVHES